ncbi:head-tail connector protein [Xenorhabdus bovienii]|uniref:head-tail connector protein n=1 Tax=Xenorhabdus bovienii TaxID=40576 RepID=UPI003DA1EBC7
MLSLDLVKQHCKIESDFHDDDDLLNTYIGASVKYVENYTRRSLYPDKEAKGYADDPDHLLLTADVQAAMLLLIAQWYENRSAASVGQSVSSLPFSVVALLQPYRIYGL